MCILPPCTTMLSYVIAWTVNITAFHHYKQFGVCVL